MDWTSASVIIAVVVVITGGIAYYIRERINIEKRLTKIEEQIKKYDKFFSVVEKVILSDFEDKIKKKTKRR